MAKNQGSPRFQLNKADLKKVGKGGLIAASGALLTYLSTDFLNIDWGKNTPIITAVAGILVNLGWKWIKNSQSN